MKSDIADIYENLYLNIFRIILNMIKAFYILLQYTN